MSWEYPNDCGYEDYEPEDWDPDQDPALEYWMQHEVPEEPWELSQTVGGSRW